MIVVVIMGILASLAIYSVRNYIQKAKTVEAREIVGKIMAGEEDYFAETQRYLDVTGGISSGSTDFYPSDASFNGTNKIMWGANDACMSGTVTCSQNFKRIGVVVNQPVMFRYACTTYAAGTTPSGAPHASGLNAGGVVAPREGYIVVARSDLDGSGVGFSVMAGTAMQAELFSSNLGK